MNQHEAQCILKVRDALVQKDCEEAYHWLYKIASPNFDKMSDEVWKDIERMAESPDKIYNRAMAYNDQSLQWTELKDREPEPEDILFWCAVPVVEPPYTGSMLDENFPGIDKFTHWRKIGNDFFPKQ